MSRIAFAPLHSRKTSAHSMRVANRDVSVLTNETEKKPSRIQIRNRGLILDAALDVFSQHGFRGSTLDQISETSGLSKPNILYYFSGKEEIHVTLLNGLVASWLDPLIAIRPNGDPVEEIMAYVMRKLEMARDLPRESRLFANEILQGAPRMGTHLERDLKPLMKEKCGVIQGWADQGLIAQVDPQHLIFSIWATTQHYADFDAQLTVLDVQDPLNGARRHLDMMFRRLLAP